MKWTGKFKVMNKVMTATQPKFTFIAQVCIELHSVPREKLNCFWDTLPKNSLAKQSICPLPTARWEEQVIVKHTSTVCAYAHNNQSV